MSQGMDRRTAIALGLAATAYSRRALADTVVPGDGVLRHESVNPIGAGSLHVRHDVDQDQSGTFQGG